jgi:hypothetical protein
MLNLCQYKVDFCGAFTHGEIEENTLVGTTYAP